MEYEVVIGLEIHSELDTKSKIFCACTTEFGGEPNTHCCPICTGMPGVLPVLNRKVVEYAVKAGLAMNCDISRFSKEDRKNYFYPDLPKAFQISQFDLPLCNKGYVDINIDDEEKRIGITRIHIEEDAGKLVHNKWGDGSIVDYNRCGVPLIEIVSEPDMRSPKEAKAYMEKVRSILQYIGVSDCKMEEGSLRADVNLSVRPMGQKELGTRTEMKNLNSFKAAEKACDSEILRQIKLIEAGGKVTQETRRWDDDKGISYSMRSKEEAHDYRYFPEPDLVPIELTEEQIKEWKESLPELPESRKQRYIKEFNLPQYDAEIITSSRCIADFFEEASKKAPSKQVSNWIMGDLLRTLKEKEMEAENIPFPAEYLSSLINMIEAGKISNNIAKKIFNKMFEEDLSPEEIMKKDGLESVNDEGQLIGIVSKIIENNPKSVEDYKAGKKQAIGYLMGQVMRETKGKANPQMINKILAEQLSK